MFSAIAAFGIWPALPLTGYWLFARPHFSRARGEFPVVTYFCLMSVAGIAVWSIPMLGSAVAGVYRAEVFGVLGWAITLWSLRGLLKRHEFVRRAGFGLTGWSWVLAAGLLVAAVLYLGFPHDTTLSGADEAIYANHGIYIAHHGKLTVPYPWPADSEPILSELFSESVEVYPMTYQTRKFSGHHLNGSAMTVSFPHLFKVWLAQAFSTFGHFGLLRLNGVFALLSLGIFYGLCNVVTSMPYAVIATLFLALNPSEIWLARITLSEILTQLFIWSGLLSLLVALRSDNDLLMRWAGIFLASSALVRIDAYLLVPLLFLSHLVYKIVLDPTATSPAPAWRALYLTALPAFAVIVGVYAFCTDPYFRWFSPQLMKIGVAAIASILVLLAATQKVVRTAHRWLTGTPVLVLIGLVLLGLAVYAYWIRPSMFPSFGAKSLVNLARYLSPPVVSAAILGWYVALWDVARKRKDLHLIPVLVVTAAFSTLFLWKPFAHPLHFWAVRRFVPVVIPGAVLFAAIGTQWILSRLPARWVIAASQLILVFLCVFTIRADALILTFAENKGSFAQLRQLAERLPMGRPILALGDVAAWMTPLYLAFDRAVIPVDLRTEKGRNTLKAWFAHQVKIQQGAYLLYEGNFAVPGLQTLRVEDAVLSRSFSEPTPEPLPRRILQYERTIVLYRIVGVSERSEYRNMNLGARMVWGVEESGFHGQEWHGGIPRRWTAGEARLVVPVDARRPPKALRVELASTGPTGNDLQIVVNGKQLFKGNSPAGSWFRTIDLSALPIREHVTIELLSSTFRPKDTIQGRFDPRTLGVLVQSIRLLDSRKPLSGAPLSDKGYRSQLTLAKKTEGLNMMPGQTIPLRVSVRNVGEDPWPVHTDLGQQKGSVNLGILWFAKGQPGKRLAEHRARLPYAMFHEDEVEVDVNLDPVGYDGKRLPPGHYEVWIGLVQEHVAWFYDKGDDVLKLAVEIRP